jgi:hypothetical protein
LGVTLLPTMSIEEMLLSHIVKGQLGV